MDLVVKEQIEIDFWKNSIYENPDIFTIPNIVYKLSEAKIFLKKIEKYKNYISNSLTVLEVGAGQGWASCIIKALHPTKKVIASDISSFAIEGAKHWEKLFSAEIDHKIVCKSYEIPLEDNSVDLVFCFQSAHHFVKHKETLAEVYRVLKDGGHAIYIHEPSCRKFIYKRAHERVNAKRPAVPEDVLVYKEITNFAKELNFKKVELFFEPDLSNRGPLQTIYFYVLKKLPILQKIFPTSVDYLFEK